MRGVVVDQRAEFGHVSQSGERPAGALASRKVQTPVTSWRQAAVKVRSLYGRPSADRLGEKVTTHLSQTTSGYLLSTQTTNLI